MKLIFGADGAFRWEAVTALATLALAVTGVLAFDWRGDARDASAEDVTTRAAVPDADYTAWRSKSVSFREAPASVASCEGVPPVAIRIVPLERAVEVDGRRLVEGEPIALSDTCRVTGVTLEAARDRSSGGDVHFDYRIRR